MGYGQGWEDGRAYVWWAEDSSVPVGHQEVVTFGETIGTRLCVYISMWLEEVVWDYHTGSEAFLALLELLEESEVTWDFGAHLVWLVDV